MYTLEAKKKDQQYKSKYRKSDCRKYKRGNWKGNLYIYFYDKNKIEKNKMQFI